MKMCMWLFGEGRINCASKVLWITSLGKYALGTGLHGCIIGVL